MPMRVVVESHNPRWADMFALESKMVVQALGSNSVAIHHIGSTAIPAIYAKPNIDMLIEVADIDDVNAHDSAMKVLGYFLIVVLMMSSSTVQSECVATPCYVERIGVASCRSIFEVSLESDVLERVGLKPKRAKALLKAASGVVILGKIGRSRPLPQCGEPDKQRLANGLVLKEYLILGATCKDFPVGYPTEGFVSTPCCDTLPIESPECVLSLETLGPLPAWAK